MISGERNLLAVQDLSQDMARLKQLFELFERKTSLMQILDLALRGQGVQIFIGGESGVAAPDECSVVTAPYKVDGEVVGTVGVIGPTRMAYERVIPIVDITAKLLSSALSQALKERSPRQPRHARGAHAGGGAPLPGRVPLRPARGASCRAGCGCRSCTASCCARGRRSPRTSTQQIWTPEGSPLAVHTVRQAALLQEEARNPGEVRDALRQAVDRRGAEGTAGPGGHPLYPQYADSTTASMADVLPPGMPDGRAVFTTTRVHRRAGGERAAPLADARPRREAGDELPRPAEAGAERLRARVPRRPRELLADKLQPRSRGNG